VPAPDPVPRAGRRILAIRAGALGDTIVALPAIEALRHRSAVLEVVGTAPYVHLVPADKNHSIDRALFRALFDEGADDTELRELLHRFDTVVAWSRAPGLANKLRGRVLVQSTPLPPEGVHASDHLMVALEPLGISGPAPAPRIAPPPSATAPPSRFVALHPSSGSPRKNWPQERFEALAKLARAAGLDIVWIEGEADAQVVRSLMQKVPGRVASQLPLRELSAVLAQSAVFIGNDSGVSHLAAAVGAATVAVFRGTDPVQWAPRGPRVHVAGAGASPEAVWGFACNLMARR